MDVASSPFLFQAKGLRKPLLSLISKPCLRAAVARKAGFGGSPPGCAIFVYVIRTQNTMAHRRPLGQRPCDKAHAVLAFLTVPNKRTGTFLLPELVGLKRNVCEISKVPLALELLYGMIGPCSENVGVITGVHDVILTVLGKQPIERF